MQGITVFQVGLGLWLRMGLLQTTTALYVISKSRWQQRGRFEELPLRLLVGMTRLEFQNFSGLAQNYTHTHTHSTNTTNSIYITLAYSIYSRS